jgi:Ni/Co efflux regulator RcnB
MKRLLISVFALLFATSAVAAPAAWAQTQTTPTAEPPKADDPKPGDAPKSWDAPKTMDGPKQSDTPKADYEKDKTGKSKSQVKDKRKDEKMIQ